MYCLRQVYGRSSNCFSYWRIWFIFLAGHTFLKKIHLLKLVAKKLYLSYQKNSISMFFFKKLIKWVYHDLIWFCLSKLISSFLNYILGVTWSSCSKNNITSTEFPACIFFHKGLIFDFVQTQVSFISFYSWSVNVSCSYSADISSSVK